MLLKQDGRKRQSSPKYSLLICFPLRPRRGTEFQSSICLQRTLQCPVFRLCTQPFIVQQTRKSVKLSQARLVRGDLPRSSVASLIRTEINAANSMNALTFSRLFDLTTTYFLIAGIAGINPKIATLGSVTFAKYAVQVALQYEFDAREIPANFTTG